MLLSEPVASVLSPDNVAVWSRSLTSQYPAPTSLGAKWKEGVVSGREPLNGFLTREGAHTQQ